MWLVKYHVLILCLMIVNSYALNCRSDGGGAKEADLKNIYKKCLKTQEGKSSNSNRSSDQDWRESRDHQKQEWHRDGDKEETSGRNDKSNGRERISGRNGMSDGRDDTGRNKDRHDRYRNDRMGNRKRMGDDRNDEINSNNRYGRDDYFNNRGEFPQSDEFGRDMTRFSQNNYYSSSQPPLRYKREKRPQNSGQRSQYNPNSHKISGYEDYRSEERNSSENNSSNETDNKACALHCFLENLEMTGEDGMPDRYLVTHAITKDVKNEDLKDFLQESIEECFQILDHENTEDKCDFAKNLLMCLSEKGRANCDDWNDDLKF